MAVTLRDIVNLPEFKALKLINSSTGLSNEVSGCGILDYEFDERVRHRFLKVNFSAGQLVLTSFLYAKDNEHLIMDAIKNLIAKGCSGLIVKNIFKLNISSNVIKYADLNNFPIFILKDQDILFENLIVNVVQVIKNYSSKYYYQEKLLELMNCEYDRNCLIQKTIEMNPLFEADFIVLYFKYKTLYGDNTKFVEVKDIIDKLDINISDRIIPYQSGYILIHTKELFIDKEIDMIISPFHDSLLELSESFYISCSDIHHDLVELREAVNEALYTSILIDETSEEVYHYYDDIGTYKIILPFIDNPILKNYSERYLNILLDFDAEYQGKFIDTLVEYVLVGGDIDKCAEVLDVHKNTIRYRLEKINSLLNENILIKEGYEKVAFAIRIYLCRKKINKTYF